MINSMIKILTRFHKSNVFRLTGVDRRGRCVSVCSLMDDDDVAFIQKYSSDAWIKDRVMWISSFESSSENQNSVIIYSF